MSSDSTQLIHPDMLMGVLEDEISQLEIALSELNFLDGGVGLHENLTGLLALKRVYSNMLAAVDEHSFWLGKSVVDALATTEDVYCVPYEFTTTGASKDKAFSAIRKYKD